MQLQHELLNSYKIQQIQFGCEWNMKQEVRGREREREREKKAGGGGVVRDTTVLEGEGVVETEFGSFEGSQAVPASPSGKGEVNATLCG
jgi:flagellar biosynthesis/type III secretory pathway protein FliH